MKWQSFIRISTKVKEVVAKQAEHLATTSLQFHYLFLFDIITSVLAIISPIRLLSLLIKKTKNSIGHININIFLSINLKSSGRF